MMVTMLQTMKMIKTTGIIMRVKPVLFALFIVEVVVLFVVPTVDSICTIICMVIPVAVAVGNIVPTDISVFPVLPLIVVVPVVIAGIVVLVSDPDVMGTDAEVLFGMLSGEQVRSSS